MEDDPASPDPRVTVLVTGAAGFIGSHVVDRLLSEGRDVVGLDSFDDLYSPERKRGNLKRAREHARFRLITGDVRDPEALARVPDVDAVLHLAARASARVSLDQPALYEDINVAGTSTLLAWIRARGIPSLVFASSSSVYGEGAETPFREDGPLGKPRSPYAATKRTGEVLCEAAAEEGLRVRALRYFTVFGPRQRPDLAMHAFARTLRRGGTIPVFGDGSTSRDYTFITDIVDGTLRALTDARPDGGGPTYRVWNLGRGRPVRLSDMIRTLARGMGVPPRLEYLPEHVGDMRHTLADISRACEEIGYRPSTDFETGVSSFLEWFAALPE